MLNKLLYRFILNIKFGIPLFNILSAYIILMKIIFTLSFVIYTDRIEKCTCIYTISKSWNICPSKIQKDRIMSNISKIRNIMSAALKFEKSLYAHAINCEKIVAKCPPIRIYV